MSLPKIIGVMLLIFLLEGSLVPWLIPSGWGHRIIPHFTYVCVLYSALYTTRHTALILGVSFGFLQDVVYYGHLLGVNALVMGLCAYLTGLLLEKRRSPLMMALSVIGMGCLAYDSAVYFVYKAFRVANEHYAWALLQHILPSLFLQLGFALAVYIPMRRWFTASMGPAGVDEEE